MAKGYRMVGRFRAHLMDSPRGKRTGSNQLIGYGEKYR